MGLFQPLQMKHFRLVTNTISRMKNTSHIMENQRFIQHGSTTLYTHCKNVALMSLKFAHSFNISIDEESLTRGALLHDYYLYDWHDRSKCPPLHGFVHPSIALANANATYTLSPIEVDIIKRHMFPLTPLPPKTKEGWIVSICDKMCSLYETFRINEAHEKKRRLGHKNRKRH